MDCDEVFMRLTSGPFPAGRDDDADVDAHVAICPACGALAQALRPAPDLFHEALTPSEGRGLPGYRGGQGSGQGGIATALWVPRASATGRTGQVLAAAVGRLAPGRIAPLPTGPPGAPLAVAYWSDARALAGVGVAVVAAISAMTLLVT